MSRLESAAVFLRALAVIACLLAAIPGISLAAATSHPTLPSSGGRPSLVQAGALPSASTTSHADAYPGGARVYDRPTNLSHVRASPAARVFATEEGAGAAEPSIGQTIYRVYGGDSEAGGASWSPVDPGSVPNYREVAGLPSGGASGATNTGRFVIEGTLNDPGAVVEQRTALSLDGTTGGLPEYIIPNWLDNGSVTITRVSGVNPEF
jgi:hypothetical protein